LPKPCSTELSLILKDFARLLLDAPKYTPVECLWRDLGLIPPTVRGTLLALHYHGHLQYVMERQPLRTLSRLAQNFPDTATKEWLEELQLAWVPGMSIEAWKKLCRQQVLAWARHADDAELAAKSTTRLYRDLTSQERQFPNTLVAASNVPQLAPYLESPQSLRAARILFGLRAASAPLQSVVNRQNHHASRVKPCPLCDQADEDTHHFFLDCPHLAPPRAQLFQTLGQGGLAPVIQSLDPPQLLLLLLGRREGPFLSRQGYRTLDCAVETFTRASWEARQVALDWTPIGTFGFSTAAHKCKKQADPPYKPR